MIKVKNIWIVPTALFFSRKQFNLMIHLRRPQSVMKMSWRRLEDVFARGLEDIFKASWRCLEDSLKMFLQEVLKTSSKHLEGVLIKTSSRRLEDVFWRCITQFKMSSEDVLPSWRCLFEDVLPSWIYLSWPRRLAELFWRWRQKTSSRRFHQDECLLVSF